jgi:hypothetical protein
MELVPMLRLVQVEADEQTLSLREERVIKMRYGIGYDRRYSLREIGEVFGVSLERIRQIEVRALRHLRSTRVSDQRRRLLNVNPSGDFPSAPRCGARNRRGTPCKCLALRGQGRCRRHGYLISAAS